LKRPTLNIGVTRDNVITGAKSQTPKVQIPKKSWKRIIKASDLMVEIYLAFGALAFGILFL
jgi:hypothetical protein